MINALPRAALDSMAEATILGIAATMEHPFTPHWQANSASTWRLPETLALFDFGQVYAI